jgi:hypothetical protein
VYLSARARVDAMEIGDLERALYVDRSLIKHLAMRRTLFVLPRSLLGFAQSAVGNQVAERARRPLIRSVEAAGLHRDGQRWLAQVSNEVEALLSDGRELTTIELRQAIPLLAGSVPNGEGKTWGRPLAVGPQVLAILSAAGTIVRASNAGAWHVSRPRWTSMRAFLGQDLAPIPEDQAMARLVEEWLRAFGPGTMADIRWWLGSTVTAVSRALTQLGAVEVDLDGRPGYVLADDVELVDPVEPWPALLPALDPTTMGWVERDWYLGPHRARLFDASGNAGPTAWWDGRIVGGWQQADSGEVVAHIFEDIGADGARSIEEEAARLTSWLGGQRVQPRFPSQQPVG